MQFQPTFFRTLEELLDRTRIGSARVTVADIGSQENGESAAGAVAARADSERIASTMFANFSHYPKLFPAVLCVSQ